MKNSTIRILSLAFAIFLSFPAFTACKKPAEGDWRAEVSSVLLQTTTTTPSSNKPGADNTVVNRSHPITNPDAGEVPSVSYGNEYAMVYGNKIYFPISNGFSNSLLSCVDLSQMVSYDPNADVHNQYVPVSTPMCFDPFCQHREYLLNDGIICPIFFDIRRSGISPAATFHEFYCIDYTESKGESPVFYICAAEPEYEVVGEQVIERSAMDVAIYRYDPASGERRIIVEDLSTTIYMFVICGEYLIYGDDSGLTAMDKSGTVQGTVEREGEEFEILDCIDNLLYLVDSLGTVYTAKKDLSDLQTIYSYDHSEFDASMIRELLQRAPSPAGMTIADGYLYYCADYKAIEECLDDPYLSWPLYSSSIYRIPLSDLSAAPELVVEGQCYESNVYGVTDGVLYFMPVSESRNSTESDWLQARSLASVNLSDKTVTVLEEDAFDMPGRYSSYRDSLILTSGFLLGHTCAYNHDRSYLTLYHFESGDIMYLSLSILSHGRNP